MISLARGRRWPVPYGSPEAASAADPAVPPPASVPVTAIILARDEAVNITRAVRSVGWCRQVLVVDSGSADGTPDLARAAGATVLVEPWRGFSAQREWAMRHPAVAHDWVFFLDADEWVSTELAAEIASRLGNEGHVAYSLRYRLVFAGRWIAHCGWYANSWLARLLHRDHCAFDPATRYAERATVTGSMGRLSADLVHEDAKGIAAWLHKHVRYAELEARRRRDAPPVARRLPGLLRESRRSSRPLARTVAKDIVYPLVPAKPLLLFLYMYVLRAGWRDGASGLLFCLYHAWYELTVGVLQRHPAPPAAAEAPAAQAPAVPAVPAQRPAEQVPAGRGPVAPPVAIPAQRAGARPPDLALPGPVDTRAAP